MAEVTVGGFRFFANFDSGNLARVEIDEPSTASATATAGEVSVAETIKSNVESALDFACEKPSSGGGAAERACDVSFKVWTSPDCAGTEFENGNRTWFYFGFEGGPLDHPDPEKGFKGGLGSPKMMKISVMNLNKQSKLFSQGMVPIVLRVPIPHLTGNLSKGALKQQYPGSWERLRERPTYHVDNSNFVLTFRVRSDPKAITYLAFTYPYSYKELQSYLAKLDRKFNSAEGIYYHRENAIYSLQNRRIDLLTISGTNGMMKERESRIAGLFPDSSSIRPFQFSNKKVVFVSARVHPGEAQSSYIINGFIKFLLRPSDPRSAALRKKYVFKIIPMLNPDGVFNGHYRTDVRGVNLNRVYANPDLELHPQIYAARKLLLYAHRGCEVPEPEKEKKEPADDVLFAEPRARRDSFVAGISDSSNSSSVSLNIRGPSTWLRSSIQSAVSSSPLDNSHQPAPFGVSPVIGSWYEMTETSRCSEGDESIADFSVGRETSTSSHSKPSTSESSLSFKGALQLSRQPQPTSSCDGEIKGSEEDLRWPVEEPDNEKVSTDPAVEDDGENANLDFATSTKIPKEKTGEVKSPPKILNSLCLQQKDNSGLFLYVDIHGHASKRGIFMYGNHFVDMETKVSSMLLPKIMSINCANFDFPACNFTERNMYLKDRHTGAGREGSGRVSAYKATGLVQSYTLECNFNTGRVVNMVPVASRDNGRSTPPPSTSHTALDSSGSVSIPKYTPEIFEDSGKQLAISILDLTESNPWTRIVGSPYKNLSGVKDWIRKYIKHSEEQQKLVKNSPNKTPSKSSISPGRSLRSSSRRVRTFSSASAGSEKSKKSGRSKKARSSPGSPGSYRPVSKIARKNSLNQQQSPPSQIIRIQPPDVLQRPKLQRSKSMLATLTASSPGPKRKKRSQSKSLSRMKSQNSSPDLAKEKKPGRQVRKSKKDLLEALVSEQGTSEQSKTVRKKPGLKKTKSKILPVEVERQITEPASKESKSASKRQRPKRSKTLS